MKRAKLEIFRGKGKRYYFRMVGGNGEKVAISESYITRWSAKRGARRFLELASNAQIVINV